jgi:hypothetical protein
MNKLINWFKNWKYKEEIIAIPILLCVFYIFNFIFSLFFPNSAFFDFASQIETILHNILVFIIAITSANLAIWISFPNIYKWLRGTFYDFNGEMEKKLKSNYAVALLITFIIAAALIF